MKDQDKTKEQLIEELAELRRRVAEIESVLQANGTAASPLGVYECETEGQLQASEERFRQVFDEGPIGVVLVGLDARIQSVNQRFCEMLGYSEEEIIALGLVGITYDEDWDTDYQFGMRLTQGEIPLYTIEKRYIRKDRAVIWGQLTVSMMHDAQGKPTTIIGLVEDITERKRAEEALRQSEERYRALAESTEDIIYIVNGEGAVLYGNQAAAQRLGVYPDEIVGKRQSDLFPAEIAQTHVQWIQGVFATGEALEEDELFTFGTEEVWLHVRLLPLRDEGDQITSVMGVCHDITDRKRAEEALQKAHDELEEQVRLRTAELLWANENLDIFRKFVEASGEGFGMSEFDGQILYMNPVLSRMFGEDNPKDVIGKDLSTYYPPSYMQRRNAEMIPALLQNGYWRSEETFVSRSGESFQTSQSTFLIRDGNGSPIRNHPTSDVRGFGRDYLDHCTVGGLWDKVHDDWLAGFLASGNATRRRQI